MSEESSKFFCSYAREDSEFTLKLAKELREAGASLWLDQLDILGGQRWDEAVQAALISCQGILAVLSPSAVASQNFMDEVSYALEEGKQIIPVLYRDCTMPFRLRRVQRVEFIVDYNKGFADLMRAMRLEQPPRLSEPAVPAAREQWQQPEPQHGVGAVGSKPSAGTRLVVEQSQGSEKIGKVKIEAQDEHHEPANRMATVQTVARVASRAEAFRGRLMAAVVGALMGAVIGATAFLSSSQWNKEIWWIGLFVAVPGAIAGSICGMNRKVIAVTLAAAVVGTVIGLASLTGADRVLVAVLSWTPGGAVLGAIAGVILKRYKG